MENQNLEPSININRLETHDRLVYFKKDQSQIISHGCEDCLKRNPLSLMLQEKSPYIYIFAHPRTADDGVTKRMLWQPRLTKPEPQTNSYLFRAQSKSDIIEICWMIPPREMWNAYKKGNVTESDIVLMSIDLFENKRNELAKPDPNDLPDNIINDIYMRIKTEHNEQLLMERLYKDAVKAFKNP